jgi:ABC-type multidrug transport system fused ATPase/permease subunit
MNHLVELFRLLNKSHQRQLPLMLGLCVLMAVTTLIGIAAILPFVAALADPERLHTGRFIALLYEYGGFANSQAFQIALAAGFICAVLLANAVNLFGTLAITKYAYSVGNAFHDRLFSVYLDSDYDFHLQNDGATLSRNIVYEANRLSVGMLQNAILLTASAVTAGLIFLSLLIVNPQVALVTIGALGATYLLIYASFRQTLSRNGLADSQNFARRIRVVNESLGAIKEIITLQNQHFFVGRFRDYCEGITKTAVESYAIALFPKYLLECIAAVALATVTLLLDDHGASNAAWLSQISFVGLAAYRLLPALQQMFVAFVKIRADGPALANIAPDLRRGMHRPSRTLRVQPAEASWHDRPRHCVALRGVEFRYPEQPFPAVRNLTLVIPAGALMGFIGHNGSGKTTTADLILGILKPNRGQLSIDGIAVNESNLADWRSRVAYVPQQVFLVDGSVADNIALGVAPAHVDGPRMQRAAAQAGLSGFIDELPQRYHHQIGEHGRRLSGGERQRIGVARALYRQASLLILDEATNALDGLTEADFLLTLGSIRGHRTVILIAHRASTLRCCDVLVEFDGGEIINVGNFEQVAGKSKRMGQMLARELVDDDHC